MRDEVWMNERKWQASRCSGPQPSTGIMHALAELNARVERPRQINLCSRRASHHTVPAQSFPLRDGTHFAQTEERGLDRNEHKMFPEWTRRNVAEKKAHRTTLLTSLCLDRAGKKRKRKQGTGTLLTHSAPPPTTTLCLPQQLYRL